MTTASVFSTLDPAQLYALKSQYLASLQMIDQMDTALKAQLADVGKARKQLEASMQELDDHIDAATPRKKPAPRAEPAKPARRTSRTSTRRRSAATEPDAA